MRARAARSSAADGQRFNPVGRMTATLYVPRITTRGSPFSRYALRCALSSRIFTFVASSMCTLLAIAGCVHGDVDVECTQIACRRKVYTLDSDLAGRSCRWWQRRRRSAGLLRCLRGRPRRGRGRLLLHLCQFLEREQQQDRLVIIRVALHREVVRELGQVNDALVECLLQLRDGEMLVGHLALII